MVLARLTASPGRAWELVWDMFSSRFGCCCPGLEGKAAWQYTTGHIWKKQNWSVLNPLPSSRSVNPILMTSALNLTHLIVLVFLLASFFFSFFLFFLFFCPFLPGKRTNLSLRIKIFILFWKAEEIFRAFSYINLICQFFPPSPSLLMDLLCIYNVLSTVVSRDLIHNL